MFPRGRGLTETFITEFLRYNYQSRQLAGKEKNEGE
ncbi:hypothetical protein ANRL2_02593 [Anaerolineae bacterium]|nr:hypothetical protein ANRL2_02593 [Anaerolineae bacterium]